MKIEDIKAQMLTFKDFYGSDLLGVDNISEAATKEDLEKIIDEHGRHIEAMFDDARSHLHNFKQRCELGWYDKEKYGKVR